MRTKIEVRNFAKIESAEIYFDDMVLFVGDNNSGKTLLMQLIYGIVDLISNWKADCSVVKMTETEYGKYIRFDQEWYQDVENKINLYLKENKETFIIDTFKSSIPLENVLVKFEDYEDSFYIATVSNSVSLERQDSNGDRETVFENLQVSGDLTDVLAHRILLDMLRVQNDEKQLFVPAARAGLQMLYRYMFAETTSDNVGLPLPVSDFLKFIQTYTQTSVLNSEEYELLEFIDKNLLGGQIDYENGQFIFREKGTMCCSNDLKIVTATLLF